MVYKVLLLNMQPIKPGTPGANPFSFRYIVSALGYYFCVLHNSWDPRLYVPSEGQHIIVKDTSVTTGTQTHTLLIKNTRAWVQCSYPIVHVTLLYDQGPIWLCLQSNSALQITILRLLWKLWISVLAVIRWRMPSNVEYACTQAKILCSPVKYVWLNRAISCFC